MEKKEIIQKLQETFDSVFLDEVVVTESLSAKDVPEWDSLTHISLVVSIEASFKIRFHTGEVESTSNVGELASLIKRHLDAN